MSEPMNSAAMLQELYDKQKLYENMMLYCRGMDRKELEVLKSTFWPEATDDHGSYVGNAHEFCEMAYRNQKISGHASSHHCCNTLIELNGDQAKRETMFMYVMVDRKNSRTLLLSGRYRDLCERREGEWKVLRRVCVWDWGQVMPENVDYAAVFAHPPTASYGDVHPKDPIYAAW